MSTKHNGRIIIISAPSGCGKSTIINAVMSRSDMDLRFSISATNRPPRDGETHGVNYFFLSDDEFRRHIAENDFVEYEEVYPGRFYGTLRSEIERNCEAGHNVILDIDVKGGVNVKRIFGSEALSIFIMPPSLNELRRRLEGRATDSREVIEERLGKAEYEMSFAKEYDRVCINDKLDDAVDEVERMMREYIKA